MSGRVHPMGRSMMRSLCVFWFAALSLFGGTEVAGVSNFHQVNDRIYRGAQPTRDGFESLAKMGVKTVIDLRSEGNRAAEKGQVEAVGMHYIAVPMSNFGAPTDAQIARVMAVLDDKTAGPVFIHCRRGADRTGTIVACYRISKDRWPNGKALDEARSCGMSRFEWAMQSFVKAYRPTSATQ